MGHTTVNERTGRDSVIDWIAGLDGDRLDAGVMASAVVGLIGNLLDIRSHAEGHSFAEEGFLTIPHLIFYAAFAAVAVLIAAVIVASAPAVFAGGVRPAFAELDISRR